MRWFERLLAELGHELWIGDSAKIRASDLRKQKTDEWDALLILQLMLANRFPRIWVPTEAERDLRQPLAPSTWPTRSRSTGYAYVLNNPTGSVDPLGLLSCGGSCSPVNLWWEEGAVLYQIQLELPYGLSEQDQEKAIAAVADSAILAGPR